MLGPVGVEVVEQPAGLVLLDVEAGEPQQPPASGGRRRRPWAARARDVPSSSRVDLELLDVEAQVVEAPDLLVDPVALAGVDDHGGLELVPQPSVAPHDGLRGERGLDGLVQHVAGLEVEQLAEDVDVRDLEVVVALPVGQPLAQLAGLGVDEVRRERAGVPPEQRVGQRAVLPGEAHQVQPDEQQGQRVEQPVGGVRPQRLGEQGAVGQARTAGAG